MTLSTKAASMAWSCWSPNIVFSSDATLSALADEGSTSTTFCTAADHAGNSWSLDFYHSHSSVRRSKTSGIFAALTRYTGSSSFNDWITLLSRKGVASSRLMSTLLGLDIFTNRGLKICAALNTRMERACYHSIIHPRLGVVLKCRRKALPKGTLVPPSLFSRIHRKNIMNGLSQSREVLHMNKCT